MTKKPTIETFTDQADKKTVKKNDIIKPGDWLLRWSPHEADEVSSGFALYTPSDFELSQGKGPLGGLALSAFYFMLEHGERGFVQEIIHRANVLAGRMEETGEDRVGPPARVLN